MRPSASLISATFQKEEAFLDVPFTTQEVEHAVKLKKSAGPDNLITEHLRYGGRPIITWLTGILNSVVDVENVPTISIYKGEGKDPLNVNSYRGITLNSVISKVLK